MWNFNKNLFTFVISVAIQRTTENRQNHIICTCLYIKSNLNQIVAKKKKQNCRVLCLLFKFLYKNTCYIFLYMYILCTSIYNNTLDYLHVNGNVQLVYCICSIYKLKLLKPNWRTPLSTIRCFYITDREVLFSLLKLWEVYVHVCQFEWRF